MNALELKKKREKRKKKPEEPKMDMTPMIDVTFLLLIFFLCLEFKTLEGKLASNLPKDVGVNKTKAEPIEKLDLRIAMLNPGTRVPDKQDYRRYELEGHKVYYYLGPRKVTSMTELESELRSAAKVEVPDPETGKRKKRPITIKTSGGVCYKDVTEVIDVARDANFTEITFGGGEGTLKNPKAK
ncbi:MAG: biopolymer transporter ExbD [Planctomycetes bacterium]|nr:biopolymer transporter ExbD [Planctomycetota bacterium]MCB9918133.1 biopolymer transporter ExbD [Planctomycetota bacterium]